VLRHYAFKILIVMCSSNRETVEQFIASTEQVEERNHGENRSWFSQVYLENGG